MGTEDRSSHSVFSTHYLVQLANRVKIIIYDSDGEQAATTSILESEDTGAAIEALAQENQLEGDYQAAVFTISCFGAKVENGVSELVKFTAAPRPPVEVTFGR